MDPKGTTRSKSPLPEGIRSKSLLLGLPNELFPEIASHLESFKDLNSLVRTSHFFHGMFNAHLYRRAVAAENIVRNDIVGWVLTGYRLASLTLLLDNGLSVDHTRTFANYKGTMLHILCMLYDQERSVPLAQLLIQRGANTRAKDSRSCTVLERAIDQNNSKIAALVLAHGADPNEVDSWGSPPLSRATRLDDARMVNLLVAHGAAIDGGRHGYTPLLEAIWLRNYDVIPVLLAHGADVGARNDTGQTPLHYASVWFQSEHHELAKSLLERGAIVNATDEKGRTPLHWAAMSSGSLDSDLFMVKFLLDNGADVNALSTLGFSPLQEAIITNSQRVAALLITRGADVRVLSRSQRERFLRFASGESRE
jgi:ankyrin repeat protein